MALARRRRQAVGRRRRDPSAQLTGGLPAYFYVPVNKTGGGCDRPGTHHARRRCRLCVISANEDYGRLILHREGRQWIRSAPFPDAVLGVSCSRRSCADWTRTEPLPRRWAPSAVSDRSERSPGPAGAHLEVTRHSLIRRPPPRPDGRATPRTGCRPLSATQLADDVAARLVATLVSVQGVRPLAHLVVTAGGILERVIGANGRIAGPRLDHDWSRGRRVVGTSVCVPSDSADRNDTALMASGPRGPSPQIPATFIGCRRRRAQLPLRRDADAAAGAYASELAAAVPAGQGDDDAPPFRRRPARRRPDGHRASLFPEHPWRAPSSTPPRSPPSTTRRNHLPLASH